MKKPILRFSKKIIICLMLLSYGATSQINFQWVKQMGGTPMDGSNSVATDVFGNVYTTGYFQGTGDFDPGPGTYSLTSVGGGYDIFISKIDASGNFVWAKRIGGASIDLGKDICIDGQGNVFVTGYFQSSVDFDPGPASFNLNSQGYNDLFILKLSAAGNFIWAKSMGASNYDEGTSITADASGNVFTTGYFMGTVDFDPGVGTYTMNGFGGSEDAFISKLDASGNFVWAKQFNAVTGSPQIYGRSIALDGAGNVCVGGSFTGIADFDPGPGTNSLTALNMDMFIVKLDGSGNLVWVKQMGGPSGSNTVDGLAIDAANNIYATGYTDSNTDFDPGPGTYTIVGFGATDIFVLKLDATGSFVWAKKMGGVNGDQGKSIALGSSGEVYTSGNFSTSGDFDPGVGSYTLSPGGAFISVLNNSGNFISAYSFGSASANGIVIDSWQDIYTTGSFNYTDFDPGPGTFTLTGGGSDDIFVHKLGQSICPTFSLNSSTNTYTLLCALNSLTINAVNTSTISGVTYTWTAPSLSTSTGSSYTSTAAGLYTISASAISNTCIVTHLFSIIQSTGNVIFNVNTNGSTCNNNGTATVVVTNGLAPYTYTWSTGSNSSSVTNLAPANYTVTVMDANSCSLTQTFVVTNIASPFASVPICFVTVDSLSQHNVITWDKALFPTADTFYVYRETGTNIYKKIRTQPYSAFSQFVDTVKTLYFPNTGDPNIGTYRYKIKTKDNCNNLSDFSPYHNTLFTTNNSGTFTWPQLYSIEGDPNPVSGYILERDNLSDGNWGAIGSVSGTQNFIIDPNYSTYLLTASWRIRTQWNINCTPTQKMPTSIPLNASYSNRIKLNTIGIKENKIDTYLSIYPNPSKGIVNISLKSGTFNGKKINLEIHNIIGEKVYSNNGEAFGTLQIDLSGYSNGMYFITFATENTISTGKIIVER